MSRKQAIFKTVFIRPLDVSRFLVVIPNMPIASLLIESATYPQITLGEVAIPFKGQKVYRPTTVDYGDHSWKVRIPENILMMVRRELIINAAKVRTEGKYFYGLRDIYVIPQSPSGIPLTPFVIKNAWLRGRSQVEMDSEQATTAWKWNVEFKYDAIVENVMSYGFLR